MSSIIDQKKTENVKQNDKQLNVIKSIAYQFIHLGIIIVVGTGMLYTCRGSQTNIFPTCLEFAPYTSVLPTFSTNFVETNVNITKGENGTSSTKMIFPVNENMEMLNNKSFLTWLRNLTEGPKSNQISLYFASIMQSIIAFNFSIINSIYQMCNNTLSETLIIVLLPYIIVFIYFGLAIFDGFYFLYLWFSKLPAFCSVKKPSNGSDTDKIVWEYPEGAIWNFTNWWKIIVCFFLVLFGVSTFISIPFITIAVAYTFILPFTLKTRVGEKKKYGPISLLKDVLKFKRNLIMIVLSFFLINDTASSFGAPAATAAIIICIGLYFFTNIYHTYEPNKLDNVSSGLANYDSPAKTCHGRGESLKNNSILSNLTEDKNSEINSLPDKSELPMPMQQEVKKGGTWKSRKEYYTDQKEK